MKIQFTVPGRPQPKQRPRICQGHTYTPKETAEYEERVLLAAKKAKVIPQSPIEQTIKVQLLFYMPIPKSWKKQKQEAAKEGAIYPISRPDVDNLAKSILDACNNVIYTDDSIIADLTISKRYGTEPRAEITITKL